VLGNFIHLAAPPFADTGLGVTMFLIPVSFRGAASVIHFISCDVDVDHLFGVRVATILLVSKPDTFASWPQFRGCLPLLYCRFQDDLSLSTVSL